MTLAERTSLLASITAMAAGAKPGSSLRLTENRLIHWRRVCWFDKIIDHFLEKQHRAELL